MKPEAVIRVRFLSTEDGGRESPIVGDKYGCPLMVNEEGFDCRFVLNKHSHFELGEVYEIPVKFLNPELALEALQEGAKITLWEGKVIARGMVIKILDASA